MSRSQTLASLSYKDSGLIPVNNSKETLESGCLFSSDHLLLLIHDDFENEL